MDVLPSRESDLPLGASEGDRSAVMARKIPPQSHLKQEHGSRPVLRSPRDVSGTLDAAALARLAHLKHKITKEESKSYSVESPKRKKSPQKVLFLDPRDTGYRFKEGKFIDTDIEQELQQPDMLHTSFEHEQ